MATVNKVARAGHRTARWWPFVVSPLFVVTSVLLGLWAGRLSYGVVRERARTCDGLLAVSDSTFALAWAAVVVAAMAVIVAIRGRVLTRRPGHSTFLDAAFALLPIGLIALLAAVVTQVWLSGVIGAGALIAGAVPLLRAGHRTRGSSPTPAAGWLPSAVLIAALLAVLSTLFLLSAVYADAPTNAHQCSALVSA